MMRMAMMMWMCWLCVPAAMAQEGVWALFADGTQVTADAVRDWDDPRKEPTVDGRKLFDAKNPVRLIRQGSEVLSQPPGPFVEFLNGDVLPGKVVKWEAADGATGRAAALVVELRGPLGVWRSDRSRLSVRADQVARVVWSTQPLGEQQAGLIVFRDGRRITVQSVRWAAEELTALTDDDLVSAAFSQVAEVHLPNADRLRAVFMDALQPGPNEAGYVGRLRTAGGASLTFRQDTVLVTREDYAGKRYGLHGVKPVWAQEPISVSDRFVELRSFRRANELPLSVLPATTLAQRSYTGFEWPWRRDANVQGGALASGSLSSDLGVGMHALSQVAFALPVNAQSFTTFVGLDRTMGRGGCVDLAVYRDKVQGKPLWSRRHMTGADEPAQVGPVSLEKAETLVLFVDFGHEGRPRGSDPLDIRDQVSWMHPLVTVDLATTVGRGEILAGLLPMWQDWTVAEAGLEKLDLQARPTGEGVWAVATVVPKDKLLLSRELDISLDAAWLTATVARTDARKGHRLLLKVNGEPMEHVAVTTREKPDRWQTVTWPLSKWLGERVSVELVVEPDPQAEDGAESALTWRGLGLTPMVRDLSPGQSLPRPDVNLTALPVRKYEGKDKLQPNLRTDGEPLTLHGTTFADGYGIGPKSRVELNIEDQAGRFVALVGSSNDEINLAIRIDSKQVWYRDRLDARDRLELIDLPLPEGAKTLIIERGDRGSGFAVITQAGIVR